jgi:CheY-like chemotaxis protein
MSILVVTDQAAVLVVLPAILTGEGHQVTVASDVVAGLRQLTETSFNLVITDIRQPGLTAADLISRGRVRAPGTRFLAIIGDAEDSGAPPAPADGKFRSDGILLRPFKQADLLAVVAELLTESRAFG